MFHIASRLVNVMFLFFLSASIHLIHLLLTEYMLLAIESQLNVDKDLQLQRMLDRHYDSLFLKQNSSVRGISFNIDTETSCCSTSLRTDSKHHYRLYHPPPLYQSYKEVKMSLLERPFNYTNTFSHHKDGADHIHQLNAMIKTIAGTNAVLTPPLSPVMFSHQSIQRPAYFCLPSSSSSASLSSHSYYSIGNSENSQLPWNTYNYPNNSSLRNVTDQSISTSLQSNNNQLLPMAECSFNNYTESHLDYNGITTSKDLAVYGAHNQDLPLSTSITKSNYLSGTRLTLSITIIDNK